MDITVSAKNKADTVGTLEIGGKKFACTLGRSGIINGDKKREGDGATPSGVYPLGTLFYRADKHLKPETGLRAEELTPLTSWCDNVESDNYNGQEVLPAPVEKGSMWHPNDDLMDYAVFVGYNTSPVIKGRGSAIFMHVARPDFSPTAGCIGLKAEDLLEVLKLCTTATKINIIEPL